MPSRWRPRFCSSSRCPCSRCASRIATSVKTIEANIAGMKEGDPTRLSFVSTNDEIGTLSANLNQFMEALKSSMNGVQSVSSENLRMKESLIVTTEQASASANEITAHAGSIAHQISALNENLVDSGREVQSISDSINRLNEQIHEQMAMVEESTASVTEMIASIDNVAKITDRRREATGRLVRTVVTGGEKMTATFQVVSAIGESVDSIKDITAIIENISSQTNLLAMNAAIEAAHAGDSGRGFSVLADEIRKLAGASAENSLEISKNLKIIVDRIGEASASGAEKNSAFKEIEREVTELHSSLSEIFARMNGLRSGSDQILKAMSSVQRVSSEVRSGMTEISGGIREMSAAAAKVLSIAERLGQLGEALNRELTKFKTA